MAKITIVGDACVITSDKKLEDIKLLEKYSPKALSLFEEENGKKTEVFKVCTADGAGSISKYGVCFESAGHNDEGLATLTVLLPQGIEDVMAYAEDVYGPAIMKLNRVEEQFNLALGQVQAEKAAIREHITIA